MVWGYHRKNWVFPFEQLKDSFDFTYLFHVFKEQEKFSWVDSAKRYWSEFANASNVLTQEKPELVVFMSIDSPLTMALNSWCKKKKVPTAILQHGLFHTYSFYLNLYSKEVKKAASENSDSNCDKLPSFLKSFLIKSIRWWNIDLVFNQYQVRKRKQNFLEIEALRMTPSRWRIPDKYFVFTKGGTNLWQERDRASESIFEEIGNFELDEYVAKQKIDEQVLNSNYYLLIDNALVENKEYNTAGFGYTAEFMNSFYLKLANWCKERGAGLKVKLHPYSYSSNYYKSLEGKIEFVKEAELKPLIMSSKGVFAFFSSLALPALLFKPTLLIDMGLNNQMQKDAVNWGVTQFIPFDLESKSFDFLTEKDRLGYQKFIDKYIYRLDGKSISRLRGALNSLASNGK